MYVLGEGGVYFTPITAEQTRPVTNPSIPRLHALHPVDRAYYEYDPLLTHIGDDVVLLWYLLSAFSQWKLSPFTVNLVKYNCAKHSRMASKARLLGDNTVLSVILASDHP